MCIYKKGAGVHKMFVSSFFCDVRRNNRDKLQKNIECKC